MRAAATLLSALALQLASSPGAAGAGGKRFESPKDTVRGKFWVHHPKGAPLIDSATYREVGTLKIAPVVIGMWQVSGGHGYRPNAQRVVDDMVVHRKHGFSTFDLADHYGDAEEFVGTYAHFPDKDKHWRVGGTNYLTKWVPRPGPMTMEVVRAAVQVSIDRMKTPETQKIDLMQFHWWDYSDNRYKEALLNLHKLIDEGMLWNVGLTNFDTAHCKEIIEEVGVPIVSNQVQFSLLDRRPLTKGMAAYFATKGVKILAYGTLAGGYLTEKYHGAPPPRKKAGTASLGKYMNTIEQAGGWGYLQRLLDLCHSIGKKHRRSIANVAVRWVLQQPAVAAAIVGARLGHAEHAAETVESTTFELDADDLAAFDAVFKDGKDLPGDCGDEYRRR